MKYYGEYIALWVNVLGKRMLKINQLNAFIAIAEGKGVAGAAESLFVSQPAITKSIANLEQELGVSLFDRSQHRLKLNVYGEILLRRAKAAKAELLSAQEEISFLQQQQQQLLKVNGSPAIIPKLMPRAMHLLKQSHPEINVQLTGLLDDKPKNKIGALMQGEYDLLVTVVDENEANDGLSYEKLLDIEVVFIASKGHPALLLDQPLLKDLVHFDWLFPSAGGLPYKKLRAAFKHTNTALPKNYVTIANRQMIFSLLDEGMYIAAIPYHPSCLEKNINELHVISVDASPIRWPISIIHRQHSQISAAQEAFIAQLKGIVQQSQS